MPAISRSHDAPHATLVPLRDRPIAVFDSGLGGLTVLDALRRRLPHEHLLYVGDTARVPYGPKSPATVTRYVSEISRWLMRGSIKMLVVACNTASAVALPALTGLVDPTGTVPVLGVIGPGAHAAVAASRPAGGRRIAVIGTEATIRGEAYQRVIRALDPRVEVLGRACPLFVPLTEEGWLEGEVTRGIVARYLEEVRAFGPDTLILGCTHYPLLRPAISDVMGPDVAIIDSAEPTAREVEALLAARGLLRDGEGTERFHATDGPERFRRVGELFLSRAMGEVHLLDLDEIEGRDG